MQPPLTPAPPAPTFYLTTRQPLRPASILLAIVAAVAALALILAGMAHAAHRRLTNNPDRSGSSASAASPNDDNDDPNQIDTIVLGDPADPPSPGKKGDHVSPVHPTIIVRLPRFGDQVGLIPSTDSGRLLYSWLAAFNQSGANQSGAPNTPPDTQSASYALTAALPTLSPATAAQLQLREQTGGFNLVSAREVAPGILVFRLRDQTPLGTEALGTLQVVPGSIPARIATFSLRSVPTAPPAP